MRAANYNIKNITSMNEQESWDQGVEKKDYQLQEINPKKLLEVIKLLKSQEIRTIKATFSFGSETLLKTFEQLLKDEEQIEDDNGRSHNLRQENIYGSKVMDLEGKKKHTLSFDDFIQAEIFFTHYKERLNKLSIDHNTEFKHCGRNILIVSEKSLSKMLQSELTSMKNRLQIYVFYGQQEMFKIVKSSRMIQERLKKNGIYSFLKIRRKRNPAFYSDEFSFYQAKDQIKKQVIKEVSQNPKILDFFDSGLEKFENTILFNLLVKSIKNSITQIKDLYEVELEVCQSESCFVLHCINQAFETEPIKILQDRISDLFFFSFPVQNIRSYANKFRKDEKMNNLIKFLYNQRRFYCCVDRSHIQDKEIVMEIFSGFLNELKDGSEIIIHLYSNFILRKEQKLRQKISEMANENRLGIPNQQAVYEKIDHNIRITSKKKITSEKQKQKKRLNFSNFLLKLLMLEKEQQKITNEEMQQILERNNDQPATERRNGRRGNSHKTANQSPQQTQTQEESIMKDEPSRNKADEYIGCTIDYQMIIPEVREVENVQKGNPDKKLQRIIQTEESMPFRAWKLKLPLNFLGCNPQELKLQKNKAYLVEQIGKEGKKLEKTNFISFTALKKDFEAYLVYFDDKLDEYLPTHCIKKI